MKGFLIACSVAFALIATIALTPGASWVFRNEVELLTSKRVEPLWDGEPLGLGPLPWISDPKTYSGATYEQELAHFEHLVGKQVLPAAAELLAKHPGDATVCATVVRCCCVSGGHLPDDKPLAKNSESEYLQQERLMAFRAASEGMKLEPDNAYFALTKAALAMDLGLMEEYGRALERCGKDSEYESHVKQLMAILEQAAIQVKGYRGELVRIESLDNIFLPEFSHIRGLSQYVGRTGSLIQKRDLIRSLSAMSKRESLPIGMLVAFGAIKTVLFNGHTPRSNLKDEQYLNMAKSMDANLKAAKLSATGTATESIFTEAFSYANDARQAFQQEMTRRSSIFDFEQAGGPSEAAVGFGLLVPITALAALAIAVPTVLFGLLLSIPRFNELYQAVPNLVYASCTAAAYAATLDCCSEVPSATVYLLIWVIVLLAFLRLERKAAIFMVCGGSAIGTIWIFSTPLSLSNWSWAAICLALGLSALSIKLEMATRQKLSMAGTVCVGVLAPFSGEKAVFAGLAAFGLTLLSNQRTAEGVPTKLARFFTPIQLSLLIGLSAYAAMIFRFGKLDGRFLWVGALIGFGCILLFVNRPRKSLIGMSSFLLVALSMTYTLGVGLQLVQNREIVKANRAMPSDADAIRSKIKSHPSR